MKVGKFILAFVGIAVLLSTLPIVGTLAATAGIGYAGYKIGSSIVSRSKKVAGGKDDSPFTQVNGRNKSQSESKRKSNNPYYDHRKREFHVEALPLDMKADLAHAVKGNVSFEIAGIRNTVTGRPVQDGGYMFMFKVDDLETAQRVKGFMRGDIFKNHHGQAEIHQAADGGGFIVESPSADDIRALLKVAYPSTSCRVEREVRTVNQYIVDGCSSYEEAVAKFNRGKDSLFPLRSYVETRHSVDGVEMDRRFSSEPLDVDYLNVGEYIISETVSDVRVSDITVPGGIVRRDDIASYAVSAFDSDKAERVADRCITVPQLSDSTPEHARRFLYSPEGGVLLAGKDTLSHIVSEEEPRFVFFCSDMHEAEALLSGDAVSAGRMVLVDTQMPEIRPGEFVVTIPATADMLGSLRVEGNAASDLLGNNEGAGVTMDDVQRSLVVDGLVKHGYVSARSTADISTDGALINGVPMSEVTDRLGNAKLPSLTTEEMNSWLADASEIQSVSVTVDTEKAELRVSSVVGGIQKTEIRKLSEDEMGDFAKRGELTKAEMKDFLMQTHPDYFRTYSDGNGGGTLQDPVSSFLKGEKPQKVAAKSNVQAQSPAPVVGEAQKPVQKPEPKQKPKKNNGPKL